MSRYAMAGTMDKVKGTAKEAVGKMTGDKRTEAEGKTDQAKGEMKEAAHDVKERVKGVKDSLKD
ncbi:MAG TPA: CsbD family protein [Stellaceae bacterium]|nr:CsbD family protein [Stellaceae bacterium]